MEVAEGTSDTLLSVIGRVSSVLGVISDSGGERGVAILLLRLRRSGRMVVIIGILEVRHIWISPELILVVGCFKKDRIAYLCLSLFLAPMALESFPHC